MGSCRHRADVAIIGHGLVGSVVARRLATAGIRVVLLDAGSPMSELPGTHIRNLPACQADRAFYHDLVRTHLRPASMPQSQSRPSGPAVPSMPEGNGFNGSQRAAVNLPAARVTNLHGGMGTLWNCVALRLDPDLEQWPAIAASEWSLLYDRAEDMLGVGLESSARSCRQDFLLRALAGLSPMSPRPAPVAARRRTAHPPALRWTGPAEILADVGPPARSMIEVLPQHVVQLLRHRNGRVAAAETVALETGESKLVEADVFLVAAGGIRTPALLWASGICTEGGDDSPLGRHLNDHPLAYAQVVLDPELLGISWDLSDPDPFVFIPVSETRPFHSLLLCDAYDARTLEGCIDDRLIVSLYWYALTEPRFDNRVLFCDRPRDALGLPQPTFEYSLGHECRVRHREALEDLRAVGQRLGTFLPISPPQCLSPGSSMHIMGTTSMGDSDDGRSVVDAYGRVWGFTNLYLGGTALIPTATATNPTLAACAIAIRTADRILAGERDERDTAARVGLTSDRHR